MNVKNQIISIFGAAVLAVTAVSGVAAQNETADVNVRVSAPANASISATITGGRFSDVAYRTGNSEQNATGSIVITATDTRGVGSGWTVSLSGNGPFTTGDSSFALDKFGLPAGSVQGKDKANGKGITAQALGSVSTTPQTVMVAQRKSGMGVFDDTINGTIKVPDGTLVGDYKTTLTVAITASN